VQIEVYRQTKPPLQRRPIVVSSVLLVLVGAMALQMSLSRVADPLGRTLRLVELGCSIRLPRGFVQQTGLAGGEWRIQPFEATAAPWGYAKLAVWYTRSEHTFDLEPVARTVLVQLRDGAVAPEHAAAFIQSDAVLIGTANAYEIQDSFAGLVVRVRKLPERGYLAISVSAEAPIDQWFDAFDATCRSVRFAP